MTLEFKWDSNMLCQADRSEAQANLEAEIPTACEYFDIESAPRTVALSVEHGNAMVRGIGVNGSGEEVVTIRYHLGGAHTATYQRSHRVQ